MPWWYWTIGIWLGLPLLLFLLWIFGQILGPLMRFKSCAIVKKDMLIDFSDDERILKIPFLFLTHLSVPKNNYGPRNFFYDAKFAFILATLWRPLACIAFDVYPRSGRICIRQIQGKGGVKSKLSLFRWEKFLVFCVLEYARKNGFKEVFIQAAKANRWKEKNAQSLAEISERSERLKKRYDVTAKRMGFKPDANKCHYVKLLA